jgi:NADH dehydrogenase (ubiquinone) Fe-S protein 5
MDFSECMSHCAMPAECTSRRDDYFECLHHRKEVLFSASPSALALI